MVLTYHLNIFNKIKIIMGKILVVNDGKQYQHLEFLTPLKLKKVGKKHI
jgi:hypothetical protein